MNYYHLKIGRGNGLAEQWLKGENPLGQPAAVVFFDNLTAKDYENGSGAGQAREFIDRASTPEKREQTLMVVVCGGKVWLLEPKGAVEFLPSELNEEGTPHTPKVMPVKIVVHQECKDVPMVLAGIGVNQYYAQGTFRKLNDWGNFKAIDSVAKRVGKGEHWDLEQNGPDQLIECLGSTELETLVAKVFEAHGCFVPAYRGGAMKDIDLFAYNDGAKPVQMGPLIIPAGESVSVQVKRWANGMECPPAADCLVGLGVIGPQTINGDRLLQLVREASSVRKWLRRSLHWLPETLLEKFDLGEEAPAK